MSLVQGIPELTIGLDLGDRTSRTYEVDAEGRRQAEAAVATTRQGLQRYFGSRTRCRVVLEASTHSPWVAQELTALGHEVIVANPAAMFKRAVGVGGGTMPSTPNCWPGRVGRTRSSCTQSRIDGRPPNSTSRSSKHAINRCGPGRS